MSVINVPHIFTESKKKSRINVEHISTNLIISKSLFKTLSNKGVSTRNIIVTQEIIKFILARHNFNIDYIGRDKTKLQIDRAWLSKRLMAQFGFSKTTSYEIINQLIKEGIIVKQCSFVFKDMDDAIWWQTGMKTMPQEFSRTYRPKFAYAFEISPDLFKLCINEHTLNTGYVIDRRWYKEITNEWGQADFNAIMILSHTIYNSRAFFEYEEDGNVKREYSRTKYNVPQFNHKYLAKEYNLSRVQVHDCLTKLEKLGFITRRYATIRPKDNRKVKLPNRMFIEVNQEKIKIENIQFKINNYFYGTEKNFVDGGYIESPNNPNSMINQEAQGVEVGAGVGLKSLIKNIKIDTLGLTLSKSDSKQEIIDIIGTNLEEINKHLVLQGKKEYNKGEIIVILEKLSKKRDYSFNSATALVNFLKIILTKHKRTAKVTNKTLKDYAAEIDNHVNALANITEKLMQPSYIKQLVKKLAARTPHYTFKTDINFFNYMKIVLDNEMRAEIYTNDSNYIIKETFNEQQGDEVAMGQEELNDRCNKLVKQHAVNRYIDKEWYTSDDWFKVSVVRTVQNDVDFAYALTSALHSASLLCNTLFIPMETKYRNFTDEETGTIINLAKGVGLNFNSIEII